MGERFEKWVGEVLLPYFKLDLHHHEKRLDSQDFDGLKGQGRVQTKTNKRERQTGTVKEHCQPERGTLQAVDNRIGNPELHNRDDDQQGDSQDAFEGLVDRFGSVHKSFRFFRHKVAPVGERQQVGLETKVRDDITAHQHKGRVLRGRIPKGGQEQCIDKDSN